MTRPGDDYIRPVGFAREPQAERRRWIGRILLLGLVILLAWLLLNRVIDPSDEPARPPRTEQLPGPV